MDDDGSICVIIDMILVFGPIIVAVILGVVARKEDENKKNYIGKITNEKIKNLIGINDESGVLGYSNNVFSISIITELEKILICEINNQNKCEVDTSIYDFKNILKSELAFDEQIVTSPSYGGAAVGGVLFGGAGAIVGGSKKVMRKQAKAVVLKLYIDDIKHPVKALKFFESETPIDISLIRDRIKEAEEWYCRFFTIIHRQKDLLR